MVPVETKDVILELPKRIEGRVIGKYMKDGKVRIWDGKILRCEHSAVVSDCRECKEIIHICEKCDLTFVNNTSYELHLTRDKHLLSSDELEEMKKENGKEVVKIGDKVEEYVDSILMTDPSIKSVERMGNSGNAFDTIIKLHGEEFFRGIQTKKLSQNRNSPACYSFSLKESLYKDDTLIVGGDLENEVYFVIPYFLVKHLTRVTFSLYGMRSDYFYENEQEFKDALLLGTKTTTIIKDGDLKDYFTDNIKMEYLSMERLKKVCNAIGLEYVRNRTNGNYVDGFINGKPVQCKTTTSKPGEMFQFHIVKGVQHTPYEDTDNIDFFIFNAVTPDLEDRFYVIPKFVLVEREYLKSKSSKGKTGIYLAPPGYKGGHWTLEFLDKLSLIAEKKLDTSIGKSPFEKLCIDNRLEYKKGVGPKKDIIILSIVGKKLHFIICGTKKDANDMYQVYFRRGEGKVEEKKKGQKKRRKVKQYKDSDTMDIFVIQVKDHPENFCIIPKSVLIEKGYVSTELCYGKDKLPVMSHKSMRKHWTKDYWNNFTFLK